LALAPERRRVPMFGGAGVPLAGILGMAGIIVLVALALFGFGGRGTGRPAEQGGSKSFDRASPVAVPPVTVPPVTPALAPAAASPGPASRALGPIVHARATEGGLRDDAVGGLVPDTVLRMEVEGFEGFARARAEQCLIGVRSECGNAVDVQFGERGHASFQYLVVREFAAGAAADESACRVRGTPCAIVVTAIDGGTKAAIRVLFHDALPPPASVVVDQPDGVHDGQVIHVDVAGLPAGSRALVVLCADLSTTSAGCGHPGPEAPVVAASDGTAAADLVASAGPVGRQGARCGRGSTCAVSVVSETSFVRAGAVRIRFSTPAGAAYSGNRLVAGLGFAVALVAFSLWLLRRTDWSPIGEEAAPEIDDADYADLDAIVAALPPVNDDLDTLLDAPG
jgi:hypothetical protein